MSLALNLNKGGLLFPNTFITSMKLILPSTYYSEIKYALKIRESITYP
jgi:hypothetical protein